MNVANTYKMLQEGQKAGEIDPKSDDPSDPTVMIRGFGSMLLSQLKQDVEQKLGYQIAGKGGLTQILPHKLQAIKDADEAMETRVWKRKITMFKKGK